MIEDINDYEAGELDPIDTAALFQHMINSGHVWQLQGSYGRAAMTLLEEGWCVLGPVGQHDYYGQYVPARDEVEAGTIGSVEYAERVNPEFELQDGEVH